MKGKIVSIQKKQKTSGEGSFYAVSVLGDDATTKNYLCFDAKMEEKKAGDVIEFTFTDKNGTLFLNFPKESKGYGGGGKSDLQVKINALLQSHTMPMSYAKDLSCSLVSAGVLTIPGEALDFTLHVYERLRAKITEDRRFMELAFGSGAQATPPPKTAQASAKDDFTIALQSFFNELVQQGKVVPVGMQEEICLFLSKAKTETGGLTGGKERISDMTEDEAKRAYDRFMMFRARECKKAPDDCEYYKTGGACKWIVKCPYTTEGL